jgi:hypothetical protein
MTIFVAIFIVSAIITSCGGGSIQSDAEKIVQLQCKAEALLKEMGNCN